jgi:hypothetical protein
MDLIILKAAQTIDLSEKPDNKARSVNFQNIKNDEINKKEVKKIDNFIAYLFVNALYLAFPFMLFYAPFYHGGYWFFRMLRVLITMFCGYFALISYGDDYYFTDINHIYPKIFLGIAIFFGISCIPFLVDGLRLSLPRELWNTIDFLVGGFLIFYYIERKIDHKRK